MSHDLDRTTERGLCSNSATEYVDMDAASNGSLVLQSG
jgi:hypothetical protein